MSLVHAFAALVPVSRGDWEAAAGHVEAAGKAARGSGTALGMAAWASARAALALARGDDELALRAAQTVRDTGREEALSRLGFCPWPLLEAEALIAQGRTAEARVRLKASGYPAQGRPGMTSPTYGEPGGEPARSSSEPGGTAGAGLAHPGTREGKVHAESGMASSAYAEPGGEPTANDSGAGGTAGTGSAQSGTRSGKARGEPGRFGSGSSPIEVGLADTAAEWGESSTDAAALDQVLDEVTNGLLSGVGSPRSRGLGARMGGHREERRVVRQGSEVRRFTEELAALRLYGLLAADSGDGAAAAAIFAAGRGDSRAGVVPFQLAQLEMAAGRGLRLLGQRPEAIAWLREARGRLVRLGAAPALAACDQELAACGVQTGREVSAATLGLTPTELAVASLVAAGRSNRQAAAELYISIKGIEFHLRNIFAKLGIRSRKDLADRLGHDADVMTLV